MAYETKSCIPTLLYKRRKFKIEYNAKESIFANNNLPLFVEYTVFVKQRLTKRRAINLLGSYNISTYDSMTDNKLTKA